MAKTVLPLARLGRAAEVLLVEDNYGDVLLTQEACERTRTPINLSVAGDGEDALARLRRRPPYADHPWPDLVLLDINMPRMDGRELLNAIRSDAAMNLLPVIMLTSSRAEADVVECYELRANSYIVKPGDFGRLMAIMESLDSFWLNFAALPPAAARSV